MAAVGHSPQTAPYDLFRAHLPSYIFWIDFQDTQPLSYLLSSVAIAVDLETWKLIIKQCIQQLVTALFRNFMVVVPRQNCYACLIRHRSRRHQRGGAVAYPANGSTVLEAPRDWLPSYVFLAQLPL
jgi:hypothetical protein